MSSIHDIQLSQLPMDQFKTLGEPLQLCDVDFSGKVSIPLSETFIKKFPVVTAGKANAVFFWWDLKMNPSGSILLSCAPHWSHPDTDALSKSADEVVRRNSIPWRDHWMQGCFYVRSNLMLETGATGFIVAQHDEFSWFFDVRLEMPTDSPINFPSCSCLFHTANSRNRIMQMNNHSKVLPYLQLFEGEKDKCFLFVGDHNLLALVAASVKPESKIYLLQGDPFCRLSLVNFMDKTNKINVMNELNNINIDQFTHLIAEPHFNSSVLPWDNITEFAKQVNLLRQIRTAPLSIVPCRASIHAVPVHFLNLYKIRWPLKSTCGGFDHRLFDNVIELASSMADENVEPFSLWEYPCIALGAETSIFQVNFNDKTITDSTMTVVVEDFTKTCNGIAFWVEWTIDESSSFPCGPANEITIGELITWKMEERQGVHLIPHSTIASGTINRIEIRTQFDAKIEKLAMDFSYRYQSL